MATLGASCSFVKGRPRDDIYVRTKSFVRMPYVRLGFSPGENARTESIEEAGLAEPEEVVYAPSTKFSNGFSINLFGIDFSRMNETQQGDGSSTYSDTQVHVNGENSGFDYYKQTYKGFSLENSDRYYPGQDQRYLANLKLNIEGANMYFVADASRFSFEAAFDQAFKPQQSGYTFVSMVSAAQIHFESDEMMIPETQRVFYGKDINVRSGTISSVSGLIGGGASLVGSEKNYVTNMVLLVGPASQVEVIDGYDRPNDELTLSWRVHFRLSLVWDFDYVYLSGAGQYDHFLASGDAINIKPATGFLEFAAGVRL